MPQHWKKKHQMPGIHNKVKGANASTAAPRPLLPCSECGKAPPGVSFSKNQKSKGPARRCQTCVDARRRPSGAASAKTTSPIAPSNFTDHLRSRQKSRGISDAELRQAKAHGDTHSFPDDNTIHYVYKNVCYVVARDTGAGITAWRLHPAQCVCQHSPASLQAARMDDYFWREYSNSFRCHDRQVDTFAMQLEKAGYAGMVQQMTLMKEGKDIMCDGSLVHGVASFLCSLDLSAIKWRGLVATEYFQKAALICAAGALCTPVYCKKCRGVQQMQQPASRCDESAALRWIRVLIDQASQRESGKASKPNSEESEHEMRRKEWMPGFVDTHYSIVGSQTPLMLAAGNNHYRICLELLKRGASTKWFGCPKKGDGHPPFRKSLGIVYARARSEAKHVARLREGAAASEDILALLAVGYQPCDKNLLLPAVVESGLQSFDIPGIISAAKAPRNVVWDGRYHRFLMTFEPCGCKDPTCPHATPGGRRQLSSACARMTHDRSSYVMPDRPMEDNAAAVDAFVRKHLPTLRFNVGDRVECNFGGGTWKPGVIADCWVLCGESYWHYRVSLTHARSGRLTGTGVFADDTEQCLRKNRARKERQRRAKEVAAIKAKQDEADAVLKVQRDAELKAAKLANPTMMDDKELAKRTKKLKKQLRAIDALKLKAKDGLNEAQLNKISTEKTLRDSVVELEKIIASRG